MGWSAGEGPVIEPGVSHGVRSTDDAGQRIPVSETNQQQPAVLFTAFEPSGDRIAAPVIRALGEAEPKLAIFAWGGPHMQEAGATVVSQSASGAAMGLSALKRVGQMRREVNSIRHWIPTCRLLAHVAVDSPAVNFHVAKVTRKAGARIVHLAAPQLWAWGRWRLGKLRRSTDLLLCLLPFEEEWFTNRNIPAKFIGHPSINRKLDLDAMREQMHGLPQGAPRVAIFPGSRLHEVRANIRLLVDAYAELQGRHASLGGVIVAASPELARAIRKRVTVFPTGLHMVTQLADPAIAWCDLAITVSGTMTLDIAAYRTPMIGVYKTSFLAWLGSKLLLRTSFRLLPNIIAEREIVPEFVPHFGGSLPIVKRASRYLADSKKAAIQSEELHRVCFRFANHDPAREAASHILNLIKRKDG